MTILKNGGTITGYAYETVPNKTIHEGQTHETAGTLASPSNSLNPRNPGTSLGMLARGADGLAIWRRNDPTDLTKAS